MKNQTIESLFNKDIDVIENGMSLTNSISSTTKNELPDKNINIPFSANSNIYYKLSPEHNCTFLQHEVTNLQLKLQNSEIERKSLLTQNNQLNLELNKLNNIKENFNIELTNEIRKNKAQYEKLLNEKEKEHEQELNDLNKTMTQLKGIFDNEKHNYEIKIESIRKQELKLRQDLINEYEDKLKDTEKNNQDDIEHLQFINEELQAKYNCLLVTTEHNLKVMNYQLQTSDKVNQENKSNIIKLTKLHNEDIEQKLKQFDIERNNYKDKITVYQNDIIQYKAQNDLLLKQIKDQENTIQLQTNDILNNKSNYEKTLLSLQERFELYKNKQNEINGEYNLKQQDYLRETQLLHQQIDFLNKKLGNMLIESEEKEKEHQRQLKQLEKELENEYTLKLIEITNEKNDLIHTIEQKDEQINELNNELNETNINYTNKINKIQYDNTVQNDILRNKIKLLTNENETLNNEIISLNKIIENLKGKLLNVENENLDLKSTVFFLEKEKKDKNEKIVDLLKQKEELVSKNDELKGDIEQLRRHLKLKEQCNTFNKRTRKPSNMRRKESSQSFIAISSSTVEQQPRKKINTSNISNLSIGDNDLNIGTGFRGGNSSYSRRNICKSNRSLDNLLRPTGMESIRKKDLV